MATKRGGRRQHTDWSKGVKAEAAKMMSSVSNTHAVLDTRKGFWECRDQVVRYDPKLDVGEGDKSGVDPSIVTLPVVDESLTKKTFIRLYPARPIAGIIVKGKQLDKQTGNLVETTDIKVTKMSDTTLLIRGIPDKYPETFKRETSLSKRKQYPDTDFKENKRDQPNPYNPTITMDDLELDTTPRLAKKPLRSNSPSSNRK